jgi:hypothetical protein
MLHYTAVSHNYVHKKHRVMDRHVMAFRKKVYIYMLCTPKEHVRWASQRGRLGVGLAGSLRVRVSEFGMIANEFLEFDSSFVS